MNWAGNSGHILDNLDTWSFCSHINILWLGTWIISKFPLINLMEWVLLLFPFYRWINGGIKRLSNVLKVTELVSLRGRVYTQRHYDTRVPETDHWLCCPYYTPGKMCPGCGSGFQNTLVQSFLSWQHVDFLELFSPIVQFLVFKFQIGFSHQESQDHFSMPHLYFCFQGRIVKKKVSSLENETFRLCLWTRPGQAITQIILCSAWS